MSKAHLNIHHHGETNRRKVDRIHRFMNSWPVNLVIAILILVSVILIFAEYLLPPGPELDEIHYYSHLITLIFVVELSIRFLVAPSKRVYFSKYWIDILSVLPALRIFRTLRVFRLLRLLRLFRAGIIILKQSGWISKRFEKYFGGLSLLIVSALMLVTCGALALLTFEPHNHLQSTSGALNLFLEKFWQSAFMFVSGEIVGTLPDTSSGKLVASLISVSGLVIFAVLVGTVTASMTTFFKAKMGTKDIRIEDLRNHLIICGWDRMGAIILTELEANHEVWRRGVVIVTPNADNLDEFDQVKDNSRLFHVKEDFTKMDVLDRVGAKYADTAIVLADKGPNLSDQDRDARTVLAALTMEKLNPKIFTCAELLNEENASHLQVAGVEEIITSTRITAGLFASTTINRGVSSVVIDILNHHHGSYLKKISVPKEYVGKNFMDVFTSFKTNLNAVIIGIERKIDGKFKHEVNPAGDSILNSDDLLTVIVNVES